MVLSRFLVASNPKNQGFTFSLITRRGCYWSTFSTNINPLYFWCLNVKIYRFAQSYADLVAEFFSDHFYNVRTQFQNVSLTWIDDKFLAYFFPRKKNSCFMDIRIQHKISLRESAVKNIKFPREGTLLYHIFPKELLRKRLVKSIGSFEFQMASSLQKVIF